MCLITQSFFHYTILSTSRFSVHRLILLYFQRKSYSSLVGNGHVSSCETCRTYGRTDLYKYICLSNERPPGCSTGGICSAVNVVSEYRKSLNDLSSPSGVFLTVTSPGLLCSILEPWIENIY